MEQRELEEMHEGLDQALRAALQGLGSLRERKARSDQVKADQTRVAAAADRRQFEAYQQAQDAMLRGQLGNVTDDKWWDNNSPADIAATVDLAERYADVSPYANAALTNLRSEAARRGVDLDAGRGPGEQELGEDGPILSPAADPSNDIGEDDAAVERDGAHRPAVDRQDLLDRMNGSADRTSVHEPSVQTSPVEPPTAGHQVVDERRAAPADDETTPPPAAQETPAYERSRASDMAGADPEHVATRLAVAKSFIHPIRTYTTSRSKTGGDGSATTPSRRQQLKRGK
jgi:hypothetical protein